MGLYSFMLEDSPTYGSIVTNDAHKRKCARTSLEFNCKHKCVNTLWWCILLLFLPLLLPLLSYDVVDTDKFTIHYTHYTHYIYIIYTIYLSCRTFCELFPELLEKHEEEKKVGLFDLLPIISRQSSLSLSINNHPFLQQLAPLLAPIPNETAVSDVRNTTDSTSWTAIIGVLCAIIACTFAVLALAI